MLMIIARMGHIVMIPPVPVVLAAAAGGQAAMTQHGVGPLPIRPLHEGVVPVVERRGVLEGREGIRFDEHVGGGAGFVAQAVVGPEAPRAVVLALREGGGYAGGGGVVVGVVGGDGVGMCRVGGGGRRGSVRSRCRENVVIRVDLGIFFIAPVALAKHGRQLVSLFLQFGPLFEGGHRVEQLGWAVLLHFQREFVAARHGDDVNYIFYVKNYGCRYYDVSI